MKYKIHPAIGIARVGNSGEYFIGPEQPGVHPNTSQSIGFKDSTGKIRKQGARFRIWEYKHDGTPVREINLDNPQVEYIRWRVHLANKKASFYNFSGQTGYSDLHAGGGAGLRNDLWWLASIRNSFLEIDAGEVEMIARHSDKGNYKLGTRCESTSAYLPVRYLGHTIQDRSGRLIVIGGHGATGMHGSAGSLSSPFNNDGWFDDTSDGPVKAWVKFKGVAGEIAVDPAWVMAGPPDFAPTLPNIVTLYDTLIDAAVRRVRHPNLNALFDASGANLIASGEGIYNRYQYTNELGKAAKSDGLAWLKDLADKWAASKGDLTKFNFKPDFNRDIFPILYRGWRSNWVAEGKFSSHSTMDDTKWKALGTGPDKDPHDPNQSRRNLIFNFLRNPNNPAHGGTMPKLRQDDSIPGASGFTLTRVQYAMMHQWNVGNFNSGDPASLPFSTAITPEGLDQAALENCVGGPFYPGIEASWLIRINEFYSSLFRVKPWAFLWVNPSLHVSPGFFSQQMAVPWQADFRDCADEWWPAQRPVFVKVLQGGSISASAVRWARGANPSVDADMNDFAKSKWKDRGFVLEEKNELVEKGGPAVPVAASVTAP